MRIRTQWGNRLAIGAAVLSAAIFGCSESRVDCECAPAGLQISAQAGQVQSIQASGPACASPSIACGGGKNSFSPGCAYYYVTPSAPGDCTLEVKLASGETKTKTITFRRTDGECCAGYYVNGDWNWNVME
ncbi:MAG: hypothetical protein HY898_16645 [Deltaproteobacteria bacterium]|nr:hypothetical protein [Deltaproteobacteria bacterium]